MDTVKDNECQGDAVVGWDGQTDMVKDNQCQGDAVLGGMDRRTR